MALQTRHPCSSFVFRGCTNPTDMSADIWRHLIKCTVQYYCEETFTFLQQNTKHFHLWFFCYLERKGLALVSVFPVDPCFTCNLWEQEIAKEQSNTLLIEQVCVYVYVCVWYVCVCVCVCVCVSPECCYRINLSMTPDRQLTFGYRVWIPRWN